MLMSSLKCGWLQVWFGLMLVTFIVTDCPLKEQKLNHGRIVYQDPEDVNITISPENYYLQFYCNDEYVRIGPQAIICSDGEWSDYFPVCEKMECNDPPKIENGRYKLYSGVQKLPTIGSSAVYSCNSRYELVDEFESILRCIFDPFTKSAMWIGGMPTCQEKNSCTDPGVSNDGTRMGRSFFKGDILQFSCNKGFELVGSEVIMCLPTGSWSFERPLCRPIGEYCEFPPLIPHGVVKMSAELEMVHDYYVPYDEVEIQCEDGYSYKGPARFVMCDNGGEWETEFGECAEYFCDYPEEIANGTIPELLSTSLTSFPYNFQITYVCGTGFRLVGGNIWRFCLTKGWSDGTPYCEEIQCPDPGAPDDGSIHAESFKVGAKIHFKCNTGYNLLGSFERYCMPNGQWTGELARCDTKSNFCSNPGTPINGFKNSTNYNLGDKVGFRCRSGYVLRGSEVRECLQDKTWSGKEAICIGQYDYDNSAQVREHLTTAVIEKAEKQKEEELEYYEALSSQNISGRILVTNQPGRLILYFIFDASGSIGLDNFKKSIEFAKAIVKRVGITEDGARCGAITFSSKAKVEFIPLIYANTKDVLDALDAIEYTGGGTSTTSALFLVKKDLLPLTETVLGKKGTKSVIFLLTDGRANMGGNPKEEAESLKKAGVEIYCIGITGSVNKKSLYDLASDSEKEPHVFILERYSVLAWLIEDITNGTIDYSKCGVGLENAGIDTGQKILGGANVAEPWPWMAALYFLPYGWMNPKQATLQCGGSIIHKNFILTAAHCLHAFRNVYNKHEKAKNDKRNNRKIIVKLGLTDVKDLSHAQESEVSRIFVPKYYKANNKFFDYDIALLELKRPIEFNAFVRPICLPPLELPESSTFYKEAHRGLAAGWGDEEVVEQGKAAKRKPSDYLKEIVLPIQSRDRCKKSLRDRRKKTTLFTNRMFCAGDGHQGNDTCHGDSGGPFIQSQLNEEGYLYWTQIGIVSWGFDCGLEGTYGFYTHVQELREWIDETIKSALNEAE